MDSNTGHEEDWIKLDLHIHTLDDPKDALDYSAHELLERGAWVHPGYFFGMEERGWLVISLLAPVEEFRTGVQVIVYYFRTHQPDNNCPVELKP